MTVLSLLFVFFSGVILSPSFADDQLILCESINGTSNCANNTITCNTPDSIYTNDSCTTVCIGARACVNTTLDGNSAFQFNVICNGSESCKNATIKAQDSGNLNLTITAVGNREVAAAYSKIYCPTKLTANGEQRFRNCVIYCSAGNEYGCDYMIFYARNGLNDMIIVPFDNERLFSALIFCGYTYQFKCNYNSDAAYQDSHFYECVGEGEEEKICENYTAPAFTYSPTTTPTIPTVQPTVPTLNPTYIDDANSQSEDPDPNIEILNWISGTTAITVGVITIFLTVYRSCEGDLLIYIGVILSIVGIGDFITDIIFCIFLSLKNDLLFSLAKVCLALTYISDKLVFFRAVWKVWDNTYPPGVTNPYAHYNNHCRWWKTVIIFIFGFLNAIPLLRWNLAPNHDEELDIYRIVCITCFEDIFQIIIVVIYNSESSESTWPLLSVASLVVSCVSVVARLPVLIKIIRRRFC